MNRLFFIFIPMILFASCAIKFTEEIEPYELEETANEPNMEFIGFKSGDAQWGNESRTDWQMMKDTPGVRSVGSSLQISGIAIDESSSYFGVYNFREIAAYKNKKRFITFIEIPDFDMTVTINPFGGGVGTCGFVLNCFGLLPIGIPMCIADPANTVIYMNTSANVYVHDSQIKEVIYKKVVFKLSESKKFKGDWSVTDRAVKQKIYDYYANMMATEILKEYEHIRDNPLFKEQ